MFTSSLLVLAAIVPAVSAGPDLDQTAKAVEAPIQRVTVFSDRSRIEREVRLTLGPGASSLALPQLPGATIVGSVRISLSKGTLLRVETRPVEEARLTLPEVDALLKKLETEVDTLASLQAQAGVLNGELGFLQGLSPAPAVEESARVKEGPPLIRQSSWGVALDYLEARRAALQGTLLLREQAQRTVVKKISALQAEINRLQLGAASERRLRVLAILTLKQRSTITLRLQYDVPGARWWPVYSLYFSPEQSRLNLSYAGRVQQTTGERWEDVTLRLSTAIPGQAIGLPKLLTWTLGEKREMIPRPRAEGALPRPQGQRAPPSRPSISEIDRRIDKESLAERLGLLRTLASRSPASLAGSVSLGAALASVADLSKGKSGTGFRGYGRGAGASLGSWGRAPRTKSLATRRRSKRRYDRPTAPPAPMKAPMDAPMEAAMPAMAESAVGGMEFDDISIEGKLKKSSSSRSRRGARGRTSVPLFDPTTWRRPHFSDRTLPAVAAGGFDYVFEAPTKVTLESGSEQLKVPLSATTWKADLLYETTPALKTTAYLRAKVKNTRREPVLRGKMSIFVNGDFAGEGELKTTGPGGELLIPLGADEDIRIVRHVAPTTRTEGLISKEEITDYAVHMELGNFKKRVVTVDVFDVLPKTNNEDIEVKLERSHPAVAEGPNSKGRLRWRLTLAPGKTAVIDFVYSIRRPKDWQLTAR